MGARCGGAKECGPTTLDKATAAGEGERRIGCASGGRMRATVGKGNVVVFSRNCETLKVEQSRQVDLLSPMAAQA